MKFKFLITSLLLTLLSIGVYAQSTNEPYVVIDKNGVATFYYKDKTSKPAGALPIQSTWNDSYWLDKVRQSVKKVVFDKSFGNCPLTTCAYWFYKCSNLTEITYIKEYLKTDNVTDMK